MNKLISDLNLKVAHIGINSMNENSALSVSKEFSDLMVQPIKKGSSSILIGKTIEVMKKQYLGTHGHIALKTDDLENAIKVLEANGYEFEKSTLKENSSGQKVAIYLKKEIGGFAVHLLKK